MEIRNNKQVGRYAVAKQFLGRGQVIFSETAFAYGPKSGSLPVCLGCYRRLSNLDYGCSKCGWPVCNDRCEVIDAHRFGECRVFAKARVRFYQERSDVTKVCLQYECITPLRVLLAKVAYPERWNEEVEHMESHDESRRKQADWQFDEVNVVGYLRGPCKLAAVFDEALIHRVCGILEINAFEAPTNFGVPIRCLFPKLALLSHSCVSNICHTIAQNRRENDENFEVVVRASNETDQFRELFSSYTHSLLPTFARRDNLRRTKYFECNCARCVDPTELGAETSTLACLHCSGTLRPTHPLDVETAWKCNYCQLSKCSSDVKLLHQQIQKELESINCVAKPERKQHLETLLKTYKHILHPQHAYNCHLYLLLLEHYNDEKDHAKILEYCQVLLRVLDIIEPGCSRIRGTVLYKYATALLWESNQQDSTCDSTEKFEKVVKIVGIFKEVVEVLLLEPTDSIEGAMKKEAERIILNLEKLVKDKFAILN